MNAAGVSHSTQTHMFKLTLERRIAVLGGKSRGLGAEDLPVVFQVVQDLEPYPCQYNTNEDPLH